jgi:polar amino acid transport system substrate-binding protein
MKVTIIRPARILCVVAIAAVLLFGAMLLGAGTMPVAQAARRNRGHNAAGLDAKVGEKAPLVIAVKDNSPPLGFRTDEDQLAGFEIEIAQRLGRELTGQLPILQPLRNQDRIPSLLSGKVDLAIARVTATAGRSRLVSFSIPYYWDGTALITNQPQVQKLSDMQRGRIAVLSGSTTWDKIAQRFPQSQIIEVTSYQAGQEALSSRQVDGFAADASILTNWSQTGPEMRLISPSISVEPLSVTLPKGLQHSKTQQQINQLLLRWQGEGWLQERAEFWRLP